MRTSSNHTYLLSFGAAPATSPRRPMARARFQLELPRYRARRRVWATRRGGFTAAPPMLQTRYLRCVGSSSTRSAARLQPSPIAPLIGGQVLRFRKTLGAIAWYAQRCPSNAFDAIQQSLPHRPRTTIAWRCQFLPVSPGRYRSNKAVIGAEGARCNERHDPIRNAGLRGHATGPGRCVLGLAIPRLLWYLAPKRPPPKVGLRSRSSAG